MAQNLVVDGTTQTLGGVRTYDTVQVINGGKIVVPAYNGSDKTNTGNLQIRAKSILVDATSSIVADGAGYQPRLCDAGQGPNGSAGGRGGCAVMDSGGGGAHFGAGGRGTKDCFIVAPANSCQFPAEFEEACGTRNGSSCSNTGGNCYNNNALPSVAGQAYSHSIYEIEFGAAGGDKGCRDSWDSCSVGGAGGGRIVLAAIDNGAGTLTIHGRVSAEGYRGCGSGNDSGGGGAGGSLLLVGDTVTITQTAAISAAGALGGDTNAKQGSNHNCPPCAQAPGGTCDDCGGGGGGGIISVLAGVPATIASTAVFNVSGADGGTCAICKGEAGGGAGELQLSGAYVGEVCDGYDNDFDGQVDEGLGNVSCGSGACAASVTACSSGLPGDCVPQSTPSCQPALSDTRSRFMVIVDTSASMLTDLSGVPTFGDGSLNHPGLNTVGQSGADDSRLYKAKQALTQVINAYPEIDFGLARFAQDVDTNVNCQLAHWFECAGICCSYDNPQNNSGGTPPAGACSVDAGASGSIAVQPTSPGDECINYAGSCGKPRRGADVLVGFQKSAGQSLMWLDHRETSFNKNVTEGDHCSYGSGGDCELRGTGPTPLAGSLQAVEAYLKKVRAEDRIASCRRYGVILLTDGTETCRGDPVQAAADLLQNAGVETYVIGFSVLASEQAALNAIANKGSTSGTRNAFFVGSEQQLAAALAGIVADSVVFETCNDKDDDCDLLIDEDFPLKGQPCTNGKLGECFATGVYKCAADGSGVVCDAAGKAPGTEVCNNKDDDCDGQVDEDIPGGCIPCIPQPEVCNNKDDNCNGQTDEGLKSVDCGKNVGECRPGKTKCVSGVLLCEGGQGPTQEQCNNKDDDCDGVVDGMARACYPFASGCDVATGVCKGTCSLGTEVCTAGAWGGSCVGANGPGKEECDGVDNDCDGQVDNGAECPGDSQCVEGQCTRPCQSGEFVCPAGQICKNGYCIIDPCDPADCAQNGPNHICRSGTCIDACQGVSCKSYETCKKGRCVDPSCYGENPCPAGQQCIQGQCKANPCADVSCKASEFCHDGACLPLCAYLECPEGQSCKVVDDGGQAAVRCVDDPCAKVSCGSNFECIDGKCVNEPCAGVTCPPGQSCKKGACSRDLCEVTSCPAGFYCKDGNCVTERQSNQVLATGSGGVACAVGGRPGTPPLSLLLLLGLALVVRRRCGGAR